MRTFHRLTLTLALTSAGVTAQVPAGHFLASARAPGGELYYVNTADQTTTQVTISATLQSDLINCVELVSPTLAYIGTFNNPSIYKLDLSGTTATETLLNTNPLTAGAEVVQLAVVGATVYAAQGGANNSDVWSVSTGGGSANRIVDLTSVPGWRAGGIANAMAANLTDVYICIWTVGEVYQHNLAAGTTTLLATLPTSKLPAGGFFPVNIQLAAPKLVSTTLACLSLYGDVVTIDTATGNVLNHYYAPSSAPSGYNGLYDCMTENTDNGDWALGSRDGSLNVVVPVGNGGLARADTPGLGTGANPNNNRVSGISYLPIGGNYKPYGAGCAGVGGYIPTSVGRGTPVAGNAAFKFGVDSARSGTATALFLIGVNNGTPYPFDLTRIGAPGCFQLTDIVLQFGTSTSGTNDGMGMGTINAPVPTGFTATVHTQWAVWDPTNALGVVVSDGRTLIL